MALQDRNQNFWQLACINGAALGLPAMVVGGALAQAYGAAAALSSILIGNFILWIVGLGIISMAGDRDHAIENVKDYLGKGTSIFAAFIWVLAFLIWYTLQIKGVSLALTPQIRGPNEWIVGGCLGLVVAVLGIGGIRLIKKACTVCLPLMMFYVVYAALTSESSVGFGEGWAISLPGILAIILVWLPGTVNLPTFFRHSRSRADTVFGLILVTLLHVFFQAGAVFMHVADSGSFLLNKSEQGDVIGIGFVLICFILSNLLNIYYASAGWETILPVKRNRIEYFLVGFFGSLAYVIFLILPSQDTVRFTMEFWESILSSFIASLGAVLLIAFLIRLVVNHRPKPFEKIWSALCWFIGCGTALVVQIQTLDFDSNQALVTGVTASVLSYLIIMFIEETIWSIKHVQDAHHTKSDMF